MGTFARKMVETNKDVIYPLVYLLVKLVLTLPVAIVTVERSFSVMKYIKNCKVVIYNYFVLALIPCQI